MIWIPRRRAVWTNCKYSLHEIMPFSTPEAIIPITFSNDSKRKLSQNVLTKFRNFANYISAQFRRRILCWKYASNFFLVLQIGFCVSKFLKLYSKRIFCLNNLKMRYLKRRNCQKKLSHNFFRDNVDYCNRLLWKSTFPCRVVENARGSCVHLQCCLANWFVRARIR